MQSPFLRLCCGVLLFASAATVRALTVDHGSSVKKGVYSSPAMVEGHPAIAYTDDHHDEVKYVRATDATGAAWGPPVIVDRDSPVGGRVSLVIAGGNPAVCYFDYTSARIKYVRAKDTTGTAWDTPVIVDIGAVPPGEPLVEDYKMEIVDGNPAICYGGGCCHHLMYIRALDASGAAWGAPMTADDVNNVYESSMKVVQGNPAIIYSGDGGLWYLRALDAAGTAWGPREKVWDVTRTIHTHSPSMQVVNGQPAVSYYADELRSLVYQRFKPQTGWGPRITVDNAGIAGINSSLAVVDGRPAIGYFTLTYRDLRFALAKDGDGSVFNSWAPPVSVDSTGGSDTNPSLFTVDGRMAVVYHDVTQGSLKYLRTTGDSAITRWPVNIVVRDDDRGTVIPDGGVLDFGIGIVGSGGDMGCRLENVYSGSTALTVLGLTIDGPDAAEFSIFEPPAGTVAGATFTEFRIRYAPLTQGIKSAVLHIASNAEGAQNPFDIVLTAATVPDIVVEHPLHTALADGALMMFPLTAPGGTTDIEFTVRNPGGAELNGLALTLDGPDAGEFSIAAAPASPVAPGGGLNTAFTLRHATVTGGGKTVSLHLASNVAGSKNPFDLTVRMIPGLPDESFLPDSGEVLSMALQADGKILTGGPFSVARFHPGGSPDTGFFSPALNDGAVYCMAVQKDGRILVGGDFTRMGGRSRPGLARLRSDGSLDEAFIPPLDKTVLCLAVRPDGKILAGGDFTTTGGVSRSYLVRLLADGSLDAAFDPRPNNKVQACALQPDGAILLGGTFDSIHGSPAPGLARLHSGGTLGSFFIGFTGEVLCFAVQPDGRILTGGIGSGGIAQLTRDGLRDASMNLTTTGTILDLPLQADGKCLVAGSFSSFGGTIRNDCARINADGSLDASFNPNVEGAFVHRVAVQADGKVLLAGSFTGVGGAPHHNLARLDNDPAFTLLTNAGPSTVRWLRSGSAPEVRDVTFDLKPAGAADWTPLGNAARIPGGWELSGLTLPSSGTLRAQAYAGGSVMESVASLLTPLESWRQQYFGSAANTGDAADSADPDHDGLTNFTEFAFGLSPVDRGSSVLPSFVHTGAAFTATFTAPPGREDMIYAAGWSASMLPGTWTEITDNGAGATHVFNVPGGSERIFVRYVLKMR